MKVKEIPIQDYLKETSQANLSRHLGVSQVAIHRAIKAKRKIFVVEDNGTGKSVKLLQAMPQYQPNGKCLWCFHAYTLPLDTFARTNREFKTLGKRSE